MNTTTPKARADSSVRKSPMPMPPMRSVNPKEMIQRPFIARMSASATFHERFSRRKRKDRTGATTTDRPVMKAFLLAVVIVSPNLQHEPEVLRDADGKPFQQVAPTECDPAPEEHVHDRRGDGKADEDQERGRDAAEALLHDGERRRPEEDGQQQEQLGPARGPHGAQGHQAFSRAGRRNSRTQAAPMLVRTPAMMKLAR